MADLPTNLFMFNDYLLRKNRPPTREPKEASRLHKIATVKYAHVLQKLRSVTGDDSLSLSDIYIGRTRVPGIPQHLNFHILFKRFNDVARANYIAHPNLDRQLNELIFYYSTDKLHAFNVDRDANQFNIVLAVFTLASKLTGKYDHLKYGASEHLWYAYILAWIEAITSKGEDDFKLRNSFFEVWLDSKYDLTWFSKKHKTRMISILKELRAGKAPVEGDPRDFLLSCRRGEFSGEEFARVGTTMAIHWVISQRKYANAEKDEKKEVMRQAAGAKVTRITKEDLEASFDKKWEECSDEYENEVDIQMEEHDDMDVDMDDEAYPNIEKMDTDDNNMEPIYEGIDLTRVQWDSEWMQALLNVDLTILQREGERPMSDRVGWIDPVDGFRTLFTEEDKLAEDLKKLLCVF